MSAPRLRAVFLGRVVPIKGLLGCSGGSGSLNVEILLDVYGPEEDERYAHDCREEAQRLPTSVRVRFLGPAPSGEVRRLLSQYDVMLNPTTGESFGQAIGESLSGGHARVGGRRHAAWTSWILEAGEGEKVVAQRRMGGRH